MSARKRSAATLGLGGNRLPYAYAQKKRRLKGTYVCECFFGYRLTDDFSVISGHVEEGLDSHAAFVAVLTLAHGHDAIGHFLLADD